MDDTIDARAERLDRNQTLAEKAASRPPLDEIVRDTVSDVLKASLPGMGQLPAGTSTSQLQQWAGSAFGPGGPLVPTWIDPRNPVTGQPDPRLTQFPVGVNLSIDGERLVPFATLRDIADNVEMVRQCLNVRKDDLTSLDWGVTISKRTLKRIMADDDETSPGKAARLARAKYAEDIARVEAFWTRPDRMNGYDFGAWLGALLEDMLVIDAITVNPHLTVGRQLHSFELIDGATIKPLRDHRGGRPLPPAAAYQQILHGFPRGDYSASARPDGEMTAAELVYAPRTRRTHSMYGLSNVEQALSVADLWLKRMHWVRTEFTDGAMPTSLLESDAVDWSPEQLLQFEAALNDMLVGQTAERKHMRVLPKGMKVARVEEFAEKYNPALDELLVKLLCACFAVMPTEIGFPPSSGIGGKGHQEGEENTTYRRDYRPTATFVSGLLTQLSVAYLGLPPELEFNLLGFEVEDQHQLSEQHDIDIRNGTRTINEVRALRGDPLFDFDEADTPSMVTGAGIQFLPGALVAAAAAAGVAIAPEAIAPVNPAAGDTTDDTTDDTAPAPPPTPTTPPVPDGHIAVAGHTRRKPGATAEGKAFLAFASKRARGGKWRPFQFEHVDPPTAELLNSAGELGRLDIAKTIVADLPKGLAPTGAQRTSV